MFLKKKNIPVIIFSVSIISGALLSSLLFFGLYFMWKEKKAFSVYEKAIYGTTARLFKDDVVLSNIIIVPGRKDDFSGKPLVEGNIKNRSSKAIASILMEISFVDKDGVVVYKHRFHPFGTGPSDKNYGSPLFYPLISSTDNMLLPGDSVSFRHILGNCNNHMVERLKSDNNFTAIGSEKDLKLVYAIVGLSLI